MNSASELPTRIYVLEPNRMLRETFVQLLRKRAGLTVIGDSADSTGAAQQLAANACDVLLLSSLKALREVGLGNEANGCLKNTRAVMFGMNDDQETFFQALRAGARGYLLKDASSTEIIAAVQAVARGDASCTPKLCRLLFEYVAKGPPHRSEEAEQQGSPANELTCRQRQLMALVAKGMTNREIASSLRLSEFTVKNRIHRIMTHLQADSRHSAVDVIRMSGLFLSAEEHQTQVS